MKQIVETHTNIAVPMEKDVPCDFIECLVSLSDNTTLRVLFDANTNVKDFEGIKNAFSKQFQGCYVGVVGMISAEKVKDI